MAIRWDKFTVKSQEAVQQAQVRAAGYGNPELQPVHLLLALLEDRLGRPVVGQFQLVARLGVPAVQSNKRLTTTPALGLRPLAFVGQKVFQAGEQKRTELAGGGLHASEGLPFQKAEKEFLR